MKKIKTYDKLLILDPLKYNKPSKAEKYLLNIEFSRFD